MAVSYTHLDVYKRQAGYIGVKLKMRKNSIKNTRINGEVQKELSTIIRNEIKAVSYTHLDVYKRQV